MAEENHGTAIRNCRIAFKCNKQWEQLAKTQFGRVRYCGDCERDVFFCSSDTEILEAIRLNRCVALLECDSGSDTDSRGDVFAVGEVRASYKLE